MSEWKKVKLKDCCLKIGSGSTPKGGSTVYVDSGTSLIRSQNVYNLLFDNNGLTHITDEAAKKLKGVTIFNEDILLNITGDSVARTCVVPNDVLPARVNQHVAIVRVDKNLMNYRFLNYYLASPKMQAHMLNLAVGKGASRNAMTKQMIENFEVPCPPLPTQHRIATILSRYDSLIENYQKQIKLLEEAAQRLYKEWFVDLRFPGYENTKVVDGVPEGWKYCRIGDRYKTVLGGTPSRANSNYWGGNIPWINSGEINKLRIVCASEMITIEGLENSSTKLMPIHTTILAITGATLGQVSYTEIETCANQSVVGIIDETKLTNEYIYLNISNNILSIVNKATGGAQQHINKDIVNDYPILIPSSFVLALFKKKVSPIFDLIKDYIYSIASLTEARDRLLPRLMGGEINV